MRLGIAHHFGWAVAVTASQDYEVVDRRRIDLIDPGLPAAPIHHEGGTHPMHTKGAPPGDARSPRWSPRCAPGRRRVGSAALDEIATAVAVPIVSISVRAWPDGFPEDIAVQRRPPYESRADSVMYCQVLAELARARDGRSTATTPQSRRTRLASSVVERTRCSTARARRWVPVVEGSPHRAGRDGARRPRAPVAHETCGRALASRLT